jgi:DNA-binding LacI/PurR family transcriptional regulator
MAAISLREVAERAGVARATASTVLSGRAAEARISAETQERVRRAADDLGYHPNRLAQGLGGGRTNTLGLLIGGLQNPYFVDLLESAAERARKAGFDVVPDISYAMRRGDSSGRSVLSGWPVDGVLVWATPWQTLSDFLGPRADDLGATVYLGHARDDLTDWVAIDRAIGVRQLMQHLRARGYERIAFLHLPGGGDIRYAEYAAFCREAGRSPQRIDVGTLVPDLMRSGSLSGVRRAGVEAGLQIATLPVGERPDCVICNNDHLAVGVYNGLRRAGVVVPDEIAVAGFDGIEDGACLDRPLTTVVSPAPALIEAAIDILTRRLALGGRGSEILLPPQQLLLPSTLRIGNTT